MFSGSSARDLVTNGLEALRSAAREDPMGPGGVINHSDGWGFAVASHGPDARLKWYYRSLSPIYSDTNYQPIYAAMGGMVRLGESYGVFHALNAADKRLVKIEMVHPIMAYTKDGELYIVHNGVVNKYKIYEVLRKYGEPIDVENSSDTYVLTHLMASMYNELGDMELVLRRLAEIIREGDGLESALNTGILLIRQCCIELYATTMYSSDVLSNERRRRYYNLFIGRLSEGTFAASSTLVKVYGLSKMGDFEEVEPSKGELVYCRLRPNGVACRSA